MAPRIHVLEPACGPTPPFRRAPTKKRLQSDDEISISSASTSESSASPNPPNTAAGVKRKAPPKISPSRRRPYKRKPPREVSSSNTDEGDVVEITHTEFRQSVRRKRTTRGKVTKEYADKNVATDIVDDEELLTFEDKKVGPDTTDDAPSATATVTVGSWLCPACSFPAITEEMSLEGYTSSEDEAPQFLTG
ncbi:hypothetical protein VNI00_004674 [Paramarasmius palmivorus]|uniref:Uncharacterized protein n=1 Tax=Paramarasmius palmivorus TaxID=297713 RepID=A0AAW0DET5_9AGAR